MPGSDGVSSGQIWWARPDSSVGREQRGRRPVVIVSGELYNDTVTTLVLAAPITTTDRGWRNHVHLAGLPQPSWAMTEQVRAISRDRLVDLIGTATPSELRAIRGWVTDYLLD